MWNDIDEAIKHCEKVASGHERNCEIFTDDPELYAINKEWADNYYHITEWLKKLKTYQEGINEIKNKAKTETLSAVELLVLDLCSRVEYLENENSRIRGICKK